MSMTAGEKIRTLMSRKNISMGDMAEKTGQSRQNLSNKMKRGNFSESEIAKDGGGTRLHRGDSIHRG